MNVQADIVQYQDPTTQCPAPCIDPFDFPRPPFLVPDDILLRHFTSIVSGRTYTPRGRRKDDPRETNYEKALGRGPSGGHAHGCDDHRLHVQRRTGGRPDPGVPTATQVAAEREGSDSRGEHGGSGQGSEPEGEGGEHGLGGEGSEENGEHGPAGEGGRESREAEMSSPMIPLGQPWSGVLGGLAVSMQYDAETRTVRGTVQNTLSQRLCYVQAEPHIKSGNRTVGELGPEKLGHLSPGEEVTSSLAVASEPRLAGVSYDGYVVHMEVFDCIIPGPSPNSAGEGSEESGEHGGGEGAEGNGEHDGGAEGASESGGAAEKEGSGVKALALDETLEMTRNGARLVLGYDAASNSFEGTVENTTSGVLDRVRVEVHLSNGTELGPTIHRLGPWGGADDQPACYGGVLHGMDSTRRNRQWRSARRRTRQRRRVRRRA